MKKCQEEKNLNLKTRYPIVVFNPNALSKPTPNPAGCRCQDSLFHMKNTFIITINRIRIRIIIFIVSVIMIMMIVQIPPDIQDCTS